MSKNVWEMNRTLKVTWNHPYLEERDANDFSQMQLLIKEPLEATYTMHEAYLVPKILSPHVFM